MEFCYEPLDFNIEQIRLLQVTPLQRSRWASLKSKPNPEVGSVMIHCTLSHVNFRQVTDNKFKALSYTWGSPNLTRTIQVNGEQLRISENLWQFLYVAAQTREVWDGAWWIDQICIDQSSINERNNQVALMGQIYSKASQVLIWLGPASEDSDLALKMIGSGKVLAKASVRKNWYDDSRGYPRISSEPFWQPVLNLMQRRYFSRLWIVQEVMKAKSMKILCGRQMLPWDVFSKTVDKIYDGAAGRGFRYVNGLRPTDSVKALRQERDSERKDYGGPIARGNPSHESNSQLSRLICAFSQSESTNPRDRIFGLLGLVGPDERVEIDYSILPLKLYVNVILKLTPRGVDCYKHVFFRDDSSPGIFAKTLYRALIDPSYEVARSSTGIRFDGCRLLCDVIAGEVSIREYSIWKNHPDWIEPSSSDDYTTFGEDFDPRALHPEFTCDSILHALQYVFSWLPYPDETIAWYKGDKYDIVYLEMRRSYTERGKWRFVSSETPRYFPSLPPLPGTEAKSDATVASDPDWLPRPELDESPRWQYC